MNNVFMTSLTVTVMALAFGGAAFAADQPQGAQPDPARQQDGATPANAASDKEAYFAAISKCDEMKGVAEKQQCIDAVRKQYGQM